jgi:hypothetical protein
MPFKTLFHEKFLKIGKNENEKIITVSPHIFLLHTTISLTFLSPLMAGAGGQASGGDEGLQSRHSSIRDVDWKMLRFMFKQLQSSV